MLLMWHTLKYDHVAYELCRGKRIIYMPNLLGFSKLSHVQKHVVKGNFFASEQIRYLSNTGEEQ
jgi:hypothetical protein